MRKIEMLEDKLREEGFKVVNCISNLASGKGSGNYFFSLVNEMPIQDVDFRFIAGSLVKRIGTYTYVYARGNNKKANILVNRLSRKYENYCVDLGRYSKYLI